MILIQKIIVSILFLSLWHVAYAKEEAAYKYSNIPKELLEHADAVIRDYKMEVDIVSSHEIYVTEKYAVTILNEKGYNQAKLREGYGRFINVASIQGVLYDKEGNQIKTLKSRDMRDYAAYDGVSLVNDYRYKAFDFGYAVYPFTCEYEIETRLSSSFFIPNFSPQDDYNISVEHASLQISYPPDLHVRTRTYHIDSKPVEITEDGKKKIRLGLFNITATKKSDDFSPPELYETPTLVTVEDELEMEDMKGSLQTWQNVGKFFYDLNVNRDNLPDEVKKIVHQMVDTCHSTEQKISILYDYLKKNTRYVSIQLGIGGWQTFDANYVATKGYGDCKALSNYMKALLKEAGIVSYQALVYAGDEEKNNLELDFPNHCSNHVILCVPLSKDTVWLECTAKTLPPGYLSYFTDDRKVLLLTPSGGYVINTPAYKERENVMIRNVSIKVDSNDRVKGQSLLTYQGWFWDKEEHKVHDQSREGVNNYFNQKFSLPSCRVNNYQISEGANDYIPYLNEQISFSGSANINRTSKRVFIDPEIIKMHVEMPAANEPRQDAFALYHSYQAHDTISISIDGSYTAESLPPEVHLKYDFGEYSCKVFLENNNVLKVVSYYTQTEGVYAAKIFSDYITFGKAVNLSLESAKIVLLKKD